MDKFFKHKKDSFSFGNVNVQSIIAVGRKLERDYLRFFNGLHKLYKKGERKDELNYIIGKIRRVLTTINNIIMFGSISKKDVDKLLVEINEIDESKEVFIDEIKNTDDLKERVKEVVDETGISPQDLNITNSVIKESLALVGKTSREPLSKTMPRTQQMASDVMRGIKGAALGPFSQLFDVAAGAFKDVRGLIKRRREESIGTSDIFKNLQPSAYVGGKSDSAIIDRPGVGGIPSIGQDKGLIVASLFSFFDKNAYKAKWTKELLNKVSDTKSGMPGSKIWSGLSLGLAGVAAATLFAAREISKLIDTINEFGQVREEAGESVKKFEAKEELGRDKYVKTKISEIGKMDISGEARRKEKVKLFKEEGADWLESTEAYEKGLTTPEEGLYEDWKSGITAIGKSLENIGEFKSTFSKGPEAGKIKPAVKTVDKSSISPQPTIRGGVGESRDTDKLSKAINELSESVRKDKELPNIRVPNTGVYDSADPFINMHAAGNLTLGE